jgi:hypothetical protein
MSGDQPQVGLFSFPSEEADVYLDALWGPLFFRYERIRKDKDSAARFSDYRMVSLFLLLNLVLQLAIAWKINEVSSSTYGSIGEALFNGACWRLSSNNKFLGKLVRNWILSELGTTTSIVPLPHLPHSQSQLCFKVKAKCKEVGTETLQVL